MKEVFRKCKYVSMYCKDILKQKVMVRRHVNDVKSVVFSKFLTTLGF